MPVPVVLPVTLAIAGPATSFPVRRIYCVGQNYADHAREMGGDPERQQPFFFTKPADAVVPGGRTLPFPTCTANLHHEVELVVALGEGGSDVPAGRAADLLFGHAVGLDMTRRDVQAEAKRQGRPWDMAKGFDQSAPIGAIVPGPPPSTGEIALTVNGERRQQGDLGQMIWPVDEILAHLSRLVRLQPGDLVFTGTPAGVGPVRPGDALVGTVAGCPPIAVTYEG